MQFLSSLVNNCGGKGYHSQPSIPCQIQMTAEVNHPFASRKGTMELHIIDTCGTNVIIRCIELTVVLRCPLMEVPLYHGCSSHVVHLLMESSEVIG